MKTKAGGTSALRTREVRSELLMLAMRAEHLSASLATIFYFSSRALRILGVTGFLFFFFFFFFFF